MTQVERRLAESDGNRTSSAEHDVLQKYPRRKSRRFWGGGWSGACDAHSAAMTRVRSGSEHLNSAPAALEPAPLAIMKDLAVHCP